jgi:hypothetical protein
MELITFILGAIAGAGGLLYWQKRKTKSEDAGVTIQGGGGPGEEPGP